MNTGRWRSSWTILLCLLLAACGGGGGGSTDSTPPPQPQTIGFATAGPVSGAVGKTVANLASGGAGTGAITYVSSNAAVADVNATTGVASLLAVGTATITATKAASAGFQLATAGYSLNVTSGTQTIDFVNSGPFNIVLGAGAGNTASGGAGTGITTYASSNGKAAIVDATSGAVTGIGVGTTTITATKAADANYLQAQASYVVNVQTAGRISAWIGAAGTEVNPPALANGKQLGRARIADCGLTDTVANCSSAELSPVTAAVIADSRATLDTPAYYSIVDGANAGTPIIASTDRFSERIGHGAVYFKGRYWIVGGARPSLPGVPGPVSLEAQSDVWSSADGRTWKLETSQAAFGARYLHQTLVYNDQLWVIGGAAPSVPGGLGHVYRSNDGVNWDLVTPSAPVGTAPTWVAAAVYNGSMWIIRQGTAYSSTDGATWTESSMTGEIGGTAPRLYATLTAYGGNLWYVGGVSGTTTFNDVFKYDGTAWSQVSQAQPFSPRFQHLAFVLNDRLWVFGGRTRNGSGDVDEATAYSTLDGSNWTAESAQNTLARIYLAKVIEQPGNITVVGGVQRAYSNRVWRSNDGNHWTELLPMTFSPRLLADGVTFKGYMWLIGGGRMDGGETNDVWRSADGLNWSQVATQGPIFSGRDDHRVLVFNDRLWVIGGWNFFDSEQGTPTYNNEVWSSADGVSWTQHPNGPFAGRNGHAALVFTGRMWVIGGTNAAGSLNDVWSSADGQTWVQEQVGAAFAPRWGHTVLAFNESMWLFGGAGASGTATAYDDIWRSIDGRTWTAVAAGARFPARMQHAAVVFGERMYVVGGASGDDYFTSTHYGDVWSSSDGTTWRQDLASGLFSPRKVHTLLNHGDELYLIGGYSSRRHHDIWRSADGANWRVGFSLEISAP